MTKKQLRISYRNKRTLLDSALIQNYSIQIANKALQLPIWHFFYFHLFLTIDRNKEILTEPLLTILQGKDKNVVVPKMVSNLQLEHFLLLDNTTLVPNALGIPEPTEGIAIAEEKLDVVFVPLLAFDKKGNRVGYGKGYYDAFLQKCRPDVIKIGLSFFEASEEIKDVNELDVPLDYCITPNTTYHF